MGVAFRKVWRDLWNNKGRTLLVVLSIAVGVLAIGMILSANTIVIGQMAASQRASNPTHVRLSLWSNFDEDTVRTVARMPDVVEAEGRAATWLRWKPTLDAEWEDGYVVMRDDYEHQLFDFIELKAGHWPDSGEVAVEHDHVGPHGLPPLGGVVYFEVNDHARPVTLTGIVRDPEQFPPPFSRDAAFYVNQATFERLAGWGGYDEIRFTIADYDEDVARAVGEDVKDKLLRSGIPGGLPYLNDPARHPVQDMIEGIGVILAVMAVVSLVLSTVLVINTINAVIAQQVPQIGLMKTVGGLNGQIASLYLAGVTVYGLLSLLVAVPLGAYGGLAMSRWMLQLLNVPATEFEVLPQSFLMQIGAGLLTPLLAALWPILQGTAISVRAALSTYGLGTGHYGGRWLDQVMGQVRILPRMSVLALRNTFRRVGRLLLTEVTLIMAGAVFMMVLSTNYSFNETITDVFDSFGYDIIIGLNGWYRINEIEPLVESCANVEKVEMWMYNDGTLRQLNADGTEGFKYAAYLRAIPRDTEMFTPSLTAGRNLQPTDGHALLLNNKLADEMGVTVGDQVILELDMEGESTWTVVGLISDLSGNQRTVYVHRDTYSAEVNVIGRAGVIEVKSNVTGSPQKTLAKNLKEFLEEKGYQVSFTYTMVEDQEQAGAQFSILTTFLMIMTCLMAVVGSFGLSGTLSINVLERRREIGVMRAVGASSGDVGFIFMTEGLLLGLASWLMAIPISMLAGQYFVRAVAEAIDFPAVYYYSVQGVWIWLIVVVLLSLLASGLPARRATQISVRESLAYE